MTNCFIQYNLFFLVLDNCHHLDGKSATLRTRSLPSNVRNKKRPFSTSDNLSELYAKVYFTIYENLLFIINFYWLNIFKI